MGIPLLWGPVEGHVRVIGAIPVNNVWVVAAEHSTASLVRHGGLAEDRVLLDLGLNLKRGTGAIAARLAEMATDGEWSVANAGSRWITLGNAGSRSEMLDLVVCSSMIGG